ncbi:uncharacterized protein FMAN_09422 [Fusarium mangiferae]|uniref:Protein kinase domain-containing protein n=1 Tax=Fusarium mangiferae TaxID=192010 RepID=A0A1L7T025_FUSMA|nr:uncharacterized protein FMAN_09422 [Fusarium mangiferae]CVK91279.1 uncharacterized protein FMAN_09422 [Fusarium mangiferae]
MSRHHPEELCSGIGDGISIYIRWNDARLVVYLNRSQTSMGVSSIENSFLDSYNEACNNDDIEEAESLSDEILDAVVEAGRDTFDRLAPPPSPCDKSSQDLHTLLLPKEYSFSFQALNGIAEVVQKDCGAGQDTVLLGQSGQPFHLNIDKDCKLPIYSTKELHVVENLLNAGYIAAGDSKGEDATQRELESLWQITKSPHAAAIRVPKLLGLIANPQNGKTIGFLEEYIPVSETWELSTLGSIDDVSAIDEGRRRKWASQVQDTVDLLHKIGITWGDGKASNVLIHRETDDAWVIDFGGGWTEGWVDEELSGTVKGDEVAVKKIMEYLQVS